MESFRSFEQVSAACVHGRSTLLLFVFAGREGKVVGIDRGAARVAKATQCALGGASHLIEN